MKTRMILAVLLLGCTVAMWSCGEEEILSTHFDVVLYQDFTVSDTGTVFSVDTLVDAAAQSSEIMKYKDNIQEVTLTRVTYLLTDFNGPPGQQLTQGSVTIAREDGSDPSGMTAMGNLSLQGLLNNETQATLNSQSAELLSELVMNSPHRFRVNAQGTISEKPLDFTIRVRFYLTIRAKTL